MKTEIKNLKSAIVSDVRKGSRKDWILIGIIILSIILTFTSGIGVRASEEVEFGSHLQKEQARMSDLYLLQKSIAICEGGLNIDSLAYRNNNPGNIKSGAHRDAQGHGKFSTYTQGYLEHLKLLQRRYWGYTPYYMNHTLNYAEDPEWYRCVNYYYYGKI